MRQTAVDELSVNQESKDGLVHDDLAASRDYSICQMHRGLGAGVRANPKGQGAGDGILGLPEVTRLVDFGPLPDLAERPGSLCGMWLFGADTEAR